MKRPVRSHGKNPVPTPGDALRRCSRVWAVKNWLLGLWECGGELPQIPVDRMPASCLTCALGRTNDAGFPNIAVRQEPTFCWAAVRFLPEPMALDVAAGRASWCPLVLDDENPRALGVARCAALRRMLAGNAAPPETRQDRAGGEGAPDPTQTGGGGLEALGGVVGGVRKTN